MTIHVLPTAATVVFDGWCGFCTRSVRLLARIDRHQRLDLRAGQQLATYELTGVTSDEAARSAWTITPDGQRAAGAAAIALALAVATQNRVPLLPWRLPGVAALLERIYTWIAANRRRFRGDLPWCAQHPDECHHDAAPSCVSLHDGGGPAPGSARALGVSSQQAVPVVTSTAAAGHLEPFSTGSPHSGDAVSRAGDGEGL